MGAPGSIFPLFLKKAGPPNFYDDLVTLGLTASRQLCLDAGALASYGGSGQKWADLAGGGYDFFFGADATVTTDDPTFNGVAGALTSSEYMSYDGGDKFRYDSANETWMNNLHKDGQKMSALVWTYIPDAGATSSILGTTANGSTGAGISWQFLAAETMRIEGAGYSISTGAAVGTGAWKMVGITLDDTTTTGFFSDAGAYKQVAGADTFTWNPSSTANADHTMEIGASGNAAQPAANTTRIAAAMVWQGVALTIANHLSIYNKQKTRFGL